MASPAAAGGLRVGMVLFPDMTHPDVTGPCEVLARMPAARVYLVAAALTPIRCEHGLTIVPDVTFDTVPPLDVICVPGGTGVNVAMDDGTLREFLQRQARDARYVTSVRTGALVLGAAGLLQGYRATTQWPALNLLPLFGALPVDERIVIDRNRITAGGAAAGIDLGLVIASELFDDAVAREIRRTIEGARLDPYESLTGDRVSDRPGRKHATLDRVALTSGTTEGLAIDSLAPGTSLVVSTRNSDYRFVILFGQRLVLVKGGAMFPEATVVRLEGATPGGSAVKRGWILVGCQIEMWLGSVRITSSRVRSVSIEAIPPL